VVIDPISNLISVGERPDVRSMLTRLIDFLKTERITTLFTSLTSQELPETSEAAISSLMDTWLLVRNVEENGERNRALYVLKSRGMAHSNQVRKFLLTSKGIDIMNGHHFEPKVARASRVTQETQPPIDAENLAVENGEPYEPAQRPGTGTKPR